MKLNTQYIVMTGLLIMFSYHQAAEAQSKETLAAYAEETIAYTGGEYKDETFKYRKMSPAKVEDGKKYPLVIFLHGAGERGADNKVQLKYFLEMMARAGHREKYPSYVIAPQCRKGKRWVEVPWGDKKSTKLGKTPSEQMQVVLNIIERELKQNKNIDKSRIYLTGLSMGGYGSWELAMRRPELFAAVVPICGGGDESNAKLIKDIPIQVWHGNADRAVPVERSRMMVKALKSVDGKVEYHELDGVGHNSWTPAYTDKNGAIPFLFKHKKSDKL